MLLLLFVGIILWIASFATGKFVWEVNREGDGWDDDAATLAFFTILLFIWGSGAFYIALAGST